MNERDHILEPNPPDIEYQRAQARAIMDEFTAPKKPDYTWCDMPMAQCPHCGHEWQVEEYYELEQGDTIECPKCDNEIFVSAKDTTIQLRLATHP
jgi:DNA-directed RNA polymerase subunit RPC12/RpoP